MRTELEDFLFEFRCAMFREPRYLDAGWWPAFAAVGVLVAIMFASLAWATARSRAALS